MGEITCGPSMIHGAVEFCQKLAALSFRLVFVKQKMSIIWSLEPPRQAPSHTGRNFFNLFQISFTANTADTNPEVSRVSKDQKILRNPKLPVARSTIHPSMSKIKHNLPFFNEF